MCWTATSAGRTRKSTSGERSSLFVFEHTISEAVFLSHLSEAVFGNADDKSRSSALRNSLRTRACRLAAAVWVDGDELVFEFVAGRRGVQRPLEQLFEFLFSHLRRIGFVLFFSCGAQLTGAAVVGALQAGAVTVEAGEAVSGLFFHEGLCQEGFRGRGIAW